MASLLLKNNSNNFINMRKILFFLSAVCMMAFVSCGKKATYLRADVDQISVGASGKSGSVALHSDGTKFELESAPDWAGVQLTDSTLSYNIGENTTGAVKEDKIAVRNGEQLLVIVLRQGIPATVLTPEKSSLSFSYEGGTQTVNVQTDATDVNVSVTDGFSAEYSNGVLTVTAIPTDGESRVEGTATLTADALEATISLAVGTKTCATCGGRGKVRCSVCKGDGFLYNDFNGMRPCKCDGYGVERCPTCGGKGRS